MRILVTIASFGHKNSRYLSKLITEYRSWQQVDVDLVILSDEPRTLRDDVAVLDGLPHSRPELLPYRHREVFYRSVKKYDLFIYSEDDVLLTRQGLDVFCEETERLGDEKVPGFVFSELWPNGDERLLLFHAWYSWDLDTAQMVNGRVYADVTNRHSPVYALTRQHLRRAIRSGNWLTPPQPTRDYNEIEAATASVFTECGLQRLIPAERIREMTVRHLPTVMRFGVPVAEVEAQLPRLRQIAAGRWTEQTLFPIQTGFATCRYDKRYFEPVRHDIVSDISQRRARVLSIGVGTGDTEAALSRSGCDVVAIPLDEAVAGTLEWKGVQVVSANWASALDELGKQRFDYILLLDVLHHVADPVRWLCQALELLAYGGTVIASVPNMTPSRWTEANGGERLAGAASKSDPSEGLMHRTDGNTVAAWFRDAGLSANLRFSKGRVRQLPKRIGKVAGRLPWVRRANGRSITVVAHRATRKARALHD